MTRWTGRSGRAYALVEDAAPREGGMASVRRVRAEGPPIGLSAAPEGAVLALKLARVEEPLACEALAREVESFETLTRAPGTPPCPRLHDVVGDPAIALVMEWCPTDLERWWEAEWSRPRAFAALCEAMAETCRRVREYAAVAELALGQRVIHADIKPRNVLRSDDGRWLLTDFGAAKMRSVHDDAWAATRMILGTENFIAPEALFNARKPVPAAMDTWAIACSFFALLRVRSLLAEGGRMPLNGTHALHFRTQRVALVTDLQQRKPGIFLDRAIDPSAFGSPERLPDKDRAAVRAALRGVFGIVGVPQEEALAEDVVALLDRALRIEPTARFTDPLDMTHEFEALAQRFRELAEDVAPDDRTAVMAVADLATEEAAVVSPPEAGAPPGEPPSTPMKEEEDPMATHPWTAPAWLKVALLGLGFGQVASLVLSGTALWQASRPPPAPPAAVVAPAQTTAVAPPVADTLPAASPVAADAATTTPGGAPADAPAAPVGRPATEGSAATEGAAAPGRGATPDATASRRPPPTPASNTADAAAGMVLVTGAQAYLVGPSGRQPVGSVAPGTYELFAQPRPDGDFQSLGTITVGSGARVVWKCGLGACRPQQ